MLKNIHVRSKLFVLLAFPVTALVVLSAFNALNKYREMQDMASAMNVVELSVASGNLIHELQKERGFSAGFAAAKGAAFSSELTTQRQTTSAFRKTLQEKIDVFVAANPSSSLNPSFKSLLDRLNRLGNSRAQVDTFAVPVSEIISRYSETIAQLQDILKSVLAYCQDPTMYGQAMDILSLVSAKEFAGQERAILNGALTAGMFDRNSYRAWLERIAMQREYLHHSLEHASPAVASIYSRRAMPLLKEVEGFRQQVFASADQPKLDGEPKAWFAASTAYIDGLHEVETAMSGELASLARKSAAAASMNFHITLAAAVSVVLLSLLLAWRIVADITSPLNRSVDFARRVAGGQLDAGLDMVRADEFGSLTKALNAMLASIMSMIAKADAATESACLEADKAREATLEAEQARKQAEQAKRDGMVAAAERISKIVVVLSSVSQDISSQLELSNKGAHDQSQRLTSAAAAMEEMNATVLEVAKNSSYAANIADSARDQAQQGSRKVTDVERHLTKVLENTQQLKEAMSLLGTRVQNVDKVLNTISDIADQTNLLALNAAIEAARAGEAGRGFAVVADEVRKLAEKTMTATHEVGDVLTGIQNDTENNIATVDSTVSQMMATSDLAKESGTALQSIVELFNQNRDQINSIATASAQQSATSEEINRSVDDVNRIAVETAAAMEQSTKGMQQLLNQTQALGHLIAELRSE